MSAARLVFARGKADFEFAAVQLTPLPKSKPPIRPFPGSQPRLFPKRKPDYLVGFDHRLMLLKASAGCNV